jgi:F-type H+-transporting ATPase subunit b
MPQLAVHDFVPQLVWLAISFVVLYLVVLRAGLPRVGAIIAARRQRIDGDLAKAQQIKAEAEATIAAYQKALAEARAQAQATVRETTERLSAAAAERQKKLAESLTAETKAAERRILAAKDAALANLREVAVEAAQAAALKVAGAAIDAAQARSAVDSVMRGRA